jgi:hypothetical protein
VERDDLNDLEIELRESGRAIFRLAYRHDDVDVSALRARVEKHRALLEDFVVAGRRAISSRRAGPK